MLSLTCNDGSSMVLTTPRQWQTARCSSKILFILDASESEIIGGMAQRAGEKLQRRHWCKDVARRAVRMRMRELKMIGSCMIVAGCHG